MKLVVAGECESAPRDSRSKSGDSRSNPSPSKDGLLGKTEPSVVDPETEDTKPESTVSRGLRLAVSGPEELAKEVGEHREDGRGDKNDEACEGVHVCASR